MEMIFVVTSILQAVGISLGVGCSTVAITSFFVSIADGSISPEERKMLGVVYILLRVAMGVILVTTAVLALMHYSSGFAGHFTPFVISRWVIIFVLFFNAYLMTKRVMPSNFGPAIQAGSWYTLGITMALIPLGLAQYSLVEFFVGYAAAIAVSISIVNGVMSFMKSRK
jgi:hypothetical protein